MEKVTRNSMPRLRQHERERAIVMLVVGVTQMQVANHFNVSRMTIARLKTRLRDAGTTNDRPRSGRPRETITPYLKIIHLRNRFVNASQTARQIHGRNNNRIPAQTVRNRLRQVLAEPGHVRHGFSYISQFNHNFSRITGIAATIKENILLCDYDKKNLILIDPLGNYLQKLNVDSEPYDIAITSQNIGYITQPKSRSVLQNDLDRMVELFQATCNDLSTTVFCVSAVPRTGRDFSGKVPCFLGVKIQGCLYAFPVNHDQM
ncbi:unnamed protein product [Mytilus coruscus]|uniref:Uncharacterized protein n=1 Tax=Mytilus coruscus TaxID=42192 RepID=A0A6J8CN96_MYTCO|nr:unnamed protein product [Mytilus coruscus]